SGGRALRSGAKASRARVARGKPAAVGTGTTLVTRTQPKETSGTASPLWRGDGRAVPRDDLRLVRKDLATGGVHTHLQAFRLLLHLAEAGDPTDDVTALWPEGRPVIEPA